MRVSTIIVPIGLRGEAERVVPLAAAIADAVDAPMKLVHVVSSLEAPPPSEHRRAWMEPLADKYGASLTLVENLSASKGLRDFIADEPDAAICMGVDASGGAIDVLLGSISEDILRSGHHRCFLVGPEVDRDVPVASGPVVVCVDGSDHSESILPDATAWAAATDNTIWTVMVGGEGPMPADLEEGGYVHRLAEQLDATDAEWEVLHGKDPADAIVDFARERDAGSIVMATHGRSGLSRLTMGSVALRVVHRAHCPVLVRRPPMLSAVVTD